MAKKPEAAPAAHDAATTTVAEAPDDLLQSVIAATRPQTEEEALRAGTYFHEFLDQIVKPGQVVTKDVEATIKAWISAIDTKLSEQLDEVLHQPEFQKLEGTWRGLNYLVMSTETGEKLKIRALNVTKRELFKDLEKAAEFDQSSLFKKIYEEEFGQLGGNPYGVLVGDYEFGRGAEDVALMKMISEVAAASHAPFVAAAAPKMFGFDTYTEMTNPRDLAKIFEGVEYAPWKSFRDTESSRYVSLVMPRVLGRLPYGEDFKTIDRFNFEEQVDGRDHSRYLWMNAVWPLAVRITESVATHGWMASIRGVENGGKVEGLPVHTFPTDDGEVAMKCPTEVAISDRREFELSNLGFLPLLHCKGTDYAVFLGSQTCQKPKVYMDPRATANAELSSKFNLMLCTSRFSHYLKVMARNKIGSTLGSAAAANWLNNWINQYVINPSGANAEALAKYPLSEARVDVREVAGKPGWFEAVAYVKPHFQLEALTTSIRMVAEIPK